MTSLLSTGKKKAKASRVFGGDVFNEGAETSLWYSPSPRSSRISATSDDCVEANQAPLVLFGEMETKSAKHISFEDTCKENGSYNTTNNVETNDVKKNDSFQSIRNLELTRLRAAKSPLRRNLAEKTETAIQNATSSVNQSLNACQQAKKAVVRDRSKQSKSVRFQWDEKKTEAKEFYSKVEEGRRQLLAVQRQLASAHFQEKARSQEAERLQKIAELEKEIEYNSEVFRDHQQKLKEERDKSRKKSIDARAKLRLNKRNGAEKLDTMRREEEAVIFEVRSDLHKARNEAKKVTDEDRRKSFQFRAGDARKIRDIRSKWKLDESIEEHKSFELSRAAAKDVQAYNNKIAEERRKSLATRNLDARRQRNLDRHDHLAAMEAEHESYELKWAGEKDAEEYHKKMREERRKSLASRNQESLRHAEVMRELRALNSEKEAETFMLKFAADNDAKQYLKKLADERRASLKLRGQETRRQRMYEEEQNRQTVASSHLEGALQSECQKDIENHKKAVAEKTRKSFQFRLKESRVKRLEEENQRRKLQAQDHQSFELDSLARVDVEKYLQDCKTRRRKSLAFRAKEKRRHAEWKQREQEKEFEARHQSGHLQSLDYQYMALAQQQERARTAIDALRSAGCTIKGNPFVDFLDNL